MRRFIFVTIVIFLLPFPSSAQLLDQRETLRGINAIDVVVEDLIEASSGTGVTVENIKTDVEVKLRSAGILIIRDSFKHLYVNVNIMKISESQYAYTTDIEFRQFAQLINRNNKKTSIVTTWETGGMGIVGSARTRGIREAVGDYVDIFINDFLTVNSRTSATPPAAKDDIFDPTVVTIRPVVKPQQPTGQAKKR